MLVSDFAYELPVDRIAQTPAEPRDAARLLVYDRREGTAEHTVFRQLPKFLSPGDLLVLNNTRVLPHRLLGKRRTGGRVEVLILERQGASGRGYVNPARKLREGETVDLEGGAVRMTVVGGAGQAGILEFHLAAGPDHGDLDAALAAVGRAPLPPYIRRGQDSAHGDDDAQRRLDLDRYQTVFAKEPGAVAAPTAGLHFTPAVFEALGQRGVEVAMVTLHVSPGTFAPVRVTKVQDHEMHEEHYHVPDQVAAQVARTRAAGHRVVAVGTTAARTLEASARDDRTIEAGAGSTNLFLYPGREFRVVDALLTNFHLPESTLLMLVSAFAGRPETLTLYQDAIQRGYRFYSYGDAMLVL